MARSFQPLVPADRAHANETASAFRCSRREFLASAAALATPALAQDAGRPGLHVMDTWFWQANLAVAEEAALLKRLGCAGLALSWGAKHKERMAACRDNGLPVPGIYTVLSIDEPAPAWLPDLAALLKGSGANVWLALTSKTFKRSDPEGDAKAVDAAARVADLGIPVSFYPHAGFWLERVGDGVRLAGRLARPDVGVNFNQYHWMAVEGGRDLPATLEAARPHLRAVTLNGSARKASILPLGEGDYDTFAIVKAAVALGFRGPFASQGYSIRTDVPRRLEAARKTWDAWMETLPR